MISAADSPVFQRYWIDVQGNYGFVKAEHMADFQKALEAQQKEAAKGLADRMQNNTGSVKLTGEQKKVLSENFDPENMSQLEYQDFIDKLCAFGVLDEADKGFVGYGVKGCGLDLTPLAYARTGVTLSPARGNPMGYTAAFSSSRGNAAAWASYLSGVKVWSEETRSWEKGPEALLFGKVSDVLDAISK